MCLTVSFVPDTDADGLVVKCLKAVYKCVDGDYVTQILAAKIPDNGWLLPHPRDTGIYDLRDGWVIEGCAIHAYLPHSEGLLVPQVKVNKPFATTVGIISCRFPWFLQPGRCFLFYDLSVSIPRVWLLRSESEIRVSIPKWNF